MQLQPKGAVNANNQLDDLSVEKQLTSALGDKGIVLPPESVSACHVLPPRDKDNGYIQPPRAIIRFTSRKTKTAIIKQAKQVKGSNNYINEHLTSTSQTLAWAARQLKKKRTHYINMDSRL